MGLGTLKSQFRPLNTSFSAGEDRDLPLLATKLYRPPVTPDLEQRNRLIEHLERNRQRPLTLISAPAGYGKTMLASMWLESCGCPNAWISLDEGDNDLGTFLNYLLAAIGSIFPDIKLKTQSLLNVPNPPRASVIAHYLLNDLNQINEPFILALDDIQLIHEQAIIDLLNELLRHPLPSLHLVLIGRHDPGLPIAILRARSQIIEIRDKDLRFTPQETGGLLSNMLNRPVDEAVATDWARKTEGWVTALRLAALSLRHRSQNDDLSLRVQGDSRYLRDYLLAEVLGRLPKEYQNWLIKIAILDQFCASLCEAVCQTGTGNEADSLTGETFIEWLESENLFLVPLDDQNEWFRFHHLFRERLRDMLYSYASAGQIADIELRASLWLGAKGWIDEAIKHALAGGKPADAGRIIAQHHYQIMNSGRLDRLEKLLRLFPDEMIASNPILSIIKAQLPSSWGSTRELMISQAEQLLTSLPSGSPIAREVEGEIAVCRAIDYILTGQATEAIAESNVALSLLPPQAQYHRGQAIAAQAFGYQISGDFDRGVRTILEALSDLHLSVNARIQLQFYQAYIAFIEGDLPAAQLAAGKSLPLAKKHDYYEIIGQASYISGIAYYLHNKLDMAEPMLLALVEEPELFDSIYIAHATCALTRLYQSQRRPEKATEVLLRVIAFLEDLGHTFSLDVLRAFEVELALDRGDITLASRLSMSIHFDWNRPVWYHYLYQLTPIKLMLAKGEVRKLAQALPLLVQLDDRLSSINRKTARVEVLALLALVYAAQGDNSSANHHLTEAILLGERGGSIRSFVDLGSSMKELLLGFKVQKAGGVHVAYIDQILQAFPEEVSIEAKTILASSSPDYPRRHTPLSEPLTLRERQVLKLLMTELSTQEIADKLSISPGTLHVHTKNIYRKMQVSKRMQAVQVAREFGLV